MDIRLRYVTRRRNADGTYRWYWQRRGHPVARLPDDEAKRLEMATRLNQAADCKHGEVLPEGSIGWVVQKYKATEDYKKLAAGTLKYYNRYIREIEDLGKGIPFSVFDRRMVLDFLDTYEGIGEARKVAAVLRNLFNTAMYHRVITENHCSDLRLSTSKAREVFWQPADVAAWLEAAATHTKGEAMATAFHLLHYTAQRPGDVLAMTWARYNGDVIQLRQQKTGKLLAVATHRELRTHLEHCRRQPLVGQTIVAHKGRALSYPVFNQAWREICAMASLQNLQARDLRRTACVRLAEAGATEVQISSVTGHSIETTRQILETYIPRTIEMSRGAIARWEESNALDK